MIQKELSTDHSPGFSSTPKGSRLSKSPHKKQFSVKVIFEGEKEESMRQMENGALTECLTRAAAVSTISTTWLSFSVTKSFFLSARE